MFRSFTYMQAVPRKFPESSRKYPWEIGTPRVFPTCCVHATGSKHYRRRLSHLFATWHRHAVSCGHWWYNASL